MSCLNFFFLQGDSGGSLGVVNSYGSMEVCGIVSWGRGKSLYKNCLFTFLNFLFVIKGCARPNLPGIYTKVVNYLPWMKKIIANECLCHSRTQARTTTSDFEDAREHSISDKLDFYDE